MVLTDPEFESSILISSDEGASYQKYRLNFFVLSLLFHHTQEDWALAYSHDQKVSFSSSSSRKNEAAVVNITNDHIHLINVPVIPKNLKILGSHSKRFLYIC